VRPVHTALIALTLAGTARAEQVVLVPHEGAGMRVDAPEGWKVLLSPDERTATLSAGIVTSISLYWYGFKPLADNDDIVDTLLRVTNENLPLGHITEVSRGPTLDGRAVAAHGVYSLLGYQMHVGLVGMNDAAHDRLVAAVLVADPISWLSLSGLDTLARVVDSLASDDDPERERAWQAEVARPHLGVLLSVPEDILIP
jgi:hypothetical protein